MTKINTYFTSHIPKDVRKTKLYPYIAAICRRGQVHWTLALTALLGAINQPISASTNYKTTYGQKPTSLFLLCAGSHSDGKTIAYGLTHAAFNNYLSKELKIYHAKLSEYKKLFAQWEHNKKGTIQPEKPIYPYLATKKFTIAGTYRALAEGLPHISFSTTEAASMFGGHVYKTENRLDTVATLSTLWDGESLDNLRKESDMQICIDKRFSIDAFCQPAIMQPFLDDKILKEQGILARFLMLSSESMHRYKVHDNGIIDENDKRAQEDRLLLKKLDMKISELWNNVRYINKNPQEGIDFKTANIVESGQNIITNFYNFCEESDKEDHKYFPISDFILRGIAHVERLSVNLGLFDNPDDLNIGSSSVIDAITFFNHYSKHYYQMRMGNRKGKRTRMNKDIDSDEYKFLKFKSFMLKRNKIDRDSFTRRELSRSMNIFNNKDTLNAFLSLLYDKKFIQKDEKEQGLYHILGNIEEMFIADEKIISDDEYPWFDATRYTEDKSISLQEAIKEEQAIIDGKPIGFMDSLAESLILETNNFGDNSRYLTEMRAKKILKLPDKFQDLFTRLISIYTIEGGGTSIKDNIIIHNIEYLLSEEGLIYLRLIAEDERLAEIWGGREIATYIRTVGKIDRIFAITYNSITYREEENGIIKQFGVPIYQDTDEELSEIDMYYLKFN